MQINQHEVLQNNIKIELTTQFSVQGLPKVIAKKLQGLVSVLNAPIIRIDLLKNCLAEGIPDEAALIRDYCWKIILGYLPQEKCLWSQYISKQQKSYKDFVKIFLPQNKFPDYPLLIKKDNPRYHELEEDLNLWEQIQKDTSRTHAELSFFCNPAPQIMVPFLTSARRQKFKLIYGDGIQDYRQFLAEKSLQRRTYRYDYMTRILFIYAKLNPKILYVQGMNQILAPIFYLVNSAKLPGAPLEEASCFFMFNNAISDIIELHIKDLDKSQNGIYGKLNEVNQMLVVIQPRIWSKLENLKIDPFFYCFRWMTLLFAQDFLLFDTLRIWQSIFSSENRLDYMNYFALSIIISAKDIILNNDFTTVLERLQSISEHINITQVIKIANSLQYQFKNHDFKQDSIQTKKNLNAKSIPKKSMVNKFMGFIDKYI